MQLIQRPLSSTMTTLPVSQPIPTGLYAKWEVVEGKLTCIWLKQPD